MPRPGELPDHNPEYLPTRGMSWLNDALGRGFAQGSVCLLSGDSGVGKSTLALQALGDLAQQGTKCLYLTSEQDLRDLDAAIRRVLGTARGKLPDGVGRNLHIDDRVGDPTLLPDFFERRVLSPDGEYAGCRAIVLDSIHGRGLSSSSASAYKALYAFAKRAKAAGIVTILIGHVTKEGAIAGPKTLQHNVDVVMHMQRAFVMRPLFVPKNRFGPATLDPIVLEMDGHGRVVPSPHAAAETSTVLGYSGLRHAFAEVQALVNLPKFGSPPITNAPDLPKQKVRQLIRIVGGLEGIGLAERSHEINAYVPGGRQYRQEVDLPLAVALLSSYLKLPVPRGAVFAGELDLNGAIRPLDAHHRLEFATLLVSKEEAVERVFVSDRNAEEFAALRAYGRKVGEAVAVHGVRELGTLVRVLWPNLLDKGTTYRLHALGGFSPDVAPSRMEDRGVGAGVAPGANARYDCRMSKPSDRSIPVSSFARATGRLVWGRRLARFKRVEVVLYYSRGWPKTPNAATRRALRDADARVNLLGPYDDAASMFRDLGA